MILSDLQLPPLHQSKKFNFLNIKTKCLFSALYISSSRLEPGVGLGARSNGQAGRKLCVVGHGGWSHFFFAQDDSWKFWDRGAVCLASADCTHPPTDVSDNPYPSPLLFLNYKLVTLYQ